MLSKSEWVWRHLLVDAMLHDDRRHTVAGLASTLRLAPSTVHRALARPRAIDAVKGGRSGVRTLDPYRLLILWAGHRDLAADVVYRTHVALPAPGLERELEGEFVSGAFAAYRRHFGENLVADYESVVVYGDPGMARRRYPYRRSGTELVVLEPDPLLRAYGDFTPLPQIYVDLFNLPGWQAARFFEDLNRRLADAPAA